MARRGEDERAAVELVRDPDRLDAVESDWRRLAVERGNAFVTPEWFRAWWSHYGADRGLEPCVAVARRPDGRVIGVLPLVATTGRWSRLSFAGSSLGDHFHPAAAAEDEVVVAAAVGAELAAAPRGAPAVLLENVDRDAEWWPALHGALAPAGRPVVDRETVLPAARLNGKSWAEYLGGRSRNLRSQVGRKRRALERDHEIRVRWCNPQGVGEDIAKLFELHDLRWRHRPGKTSSLTSSRARAFHADFAAAAARQGWLRLCFLEVDGAAVAGWYGWRLDGRFAYYQAGFDPAWGERSVGFVLFAETIRTAIEEGAAEYDMLLGDEEYKGRFADSQRPVCTALVAPTWHRQRLLAVAETAARRLATRAPERWREPLKRASRSARERLPMARRR